MQINLIFIVLILFVACSKPLVRLSDFSENKASRTIPCEEKAVEKSLEALEQKYRCTSEQ